MKTYIALLRGINVSGQIKIVMSGIIMFLCIFPMVMEKQKSNESRTEKI
jgi:hypothetical protein